MSIWLQVARAAAAANVLLLLALGRVWVGNYREHGASHSLVLSLFAAFLLLENALWVALYVTHEGFVDWYRVVDPPLQAGIAMLCGLEFVALLFMLYITWR